MTTKPTLALIAVKAGSLQSSLLALMTTMPQVNAVIVAEKARLAQRMIAEHRPDMVLLDMDLPGNGAQATVGRIKANWPQTRCIILADDVRQQQEAQAAGADVSLIKGFSPARLIEAVEELLSQGNTDHFVNLEAK